MPFFRLSTSKHRHDFVLKGYDYRMYELISKRLFSDLVRRRGLGRVLDSRLFRTTSVCQPSIEEKLFYEHFLYLSLCCYFLSTVNI